MDTIIIMILPEECFEVLRQFSPTSITWIHGDEDTNRGDHLDLFTKEVESLFLVSDGILDALNLKQFWVIIEGKSIFSLRSPFIASNNLN